MDPRLNIAIRAARKAGSVISQYADHIDSLKITEKSRNDFVSEVDCAAEKEIISILKRSYPDHAILAEESGEKTGNENVWIIVPLDGTTNFLHGFPVFAVSIALKCRDNIEVGVVYDPIRQDIFAASRGSGATLNDRKIRVTPKKTLEGALLGTGFPYRDLSYMDNYLKMFSELMKDTAGIRRAGSAAIDLAYVAAGRLDGFWEIGLKPWDMAAGILLINEAGGTVSDFNDDKNSLECGQIVAGNHKIHQAILRIIEPYITSDM